MGQNAASTPMLCGRSAVPNYSEFTITLPTDTGASPSKVFEIQGKVIVHGVYVQVTRFGGVDQNIAGYLENAWLTNWIYFSGYNLTVLQCAAGNKTTGALYYPAESGAGLLRMTTWLDITSGVAAFEYYWDTTYV